jgi:hypothetical protein
VFFPRSAYVDGSASAANIDTSTACSRAYAGLPA